MILNPIHTNELNNRAVPTGMKKIKEETSYSMSGIRLGY